MRIAWHRKKEQSISAFICGFLVWVLKLLVSIWTVLILAVMPFYFRQGYTTIGTDKSYFFRTCGVAMAKLVLPVLAAYLLCCVAVWLLGRHKGVGRPLWESLRGKLSATDVFALCYAVSVILSYCASGYKETALWGAKGWYMGLIPQLLLVGTFFLVSRFQAAVKWMIALGMLVSTVVFVLGILNRFDVWPLAMENSGRPLYISTIGNINWYCGYLVAVFFVGVGLLWLGGGEAGKSWHTVLLSLYVFIGLAALLTQGSDSGLFALAVLLLVMFVLSAKDGTGQQGTLDRMQRFWWIVCLLAGACLAILGLRTLFPGRMNYTAGLGGKLTGSPLCAVLLVVAVLGLWLAQRASGQRALRAWRLTASVLSAAVLIGAVVFVCLVFVNTRHPGSLGRLSDHSIFTFDAKWGSSRGATWTIGLRCFAEQDVLHKLVGAGPDCMADFLSNGSSESLLNAVQTAFDGKRLTNAHCELLTILVNTGLLGAVSFAGMMWMAVKRLLGARDRNGYAGACGLCVLAYIANNLWSFQQSMSVTTIFVILGMGEYFLRRIRLLPSEGVAGIG